MKPITQYQTDDNSIFAAQEDAERYEVLVAQIRDLHLGTLGELERGGDFQNGGGFIPHTTAEVEAFKEGFLALVRPFYAECREWSFGYLGRVLSDGSSPVDLALYRAWGRIACIDQQCREWGQPFFALNPTRGNQVIFVRGDQEG